MIGMCTKQYGTLLTVNIGTVGRKSHDFDVFLMEARVMTFVAHCTVQNL